MALLNQLGSTLKPATESLLDCQSQKFQGTCLLATSSSFLRLKENKWGNSMIIAQAPSKLSFGCDSDQLRQIKVSCDGRLVMALRSDDPGVLIVYDVTSARC